MICWLSWEEVKPEDKDKKILHIDPGTAFGTGMHETTQLCIRQLKKYITPETELLDVGTGSGILSIVSLMYGIHHAVGTDLDPCAVPAVAENKEANQIVDETFDMVIGNIIDDKAIQDQAGYEKYDIVTDLNQAGIGDFYLPLYYGTITCNAYTLENLIYDETTAKALLQLQFEKFCQTLQQKGIQIVENDVKIKKYQKGMKAEGSIRMRIMDGEERKIE